MERRINTYQNTVLIYNPAAGKLRRDHERIIHRTIQTLDQEGIRATPIATEGPGSATELARKAIAQGADLILAAGGDGTINETANGVVGTHVPLGILPGGTANVLAVELGLGKKIDRAARRISQCVPERIAVGLLKNHLGERHFLLMAGAGLDAKIVYEVSARLKAAVGKLAYWLAGFGGMTRRLEQFEATVSGRTLRCGFVLASRVKNYGGDLSITVKASLLEDDFEVLVFAGRNPMRYMLYFLGVLVGAHYRFRGITAERARRFELSAPTDPRIHIQVDGEYAGKLPARVEIVPDALSLLVPGDFRERLGLKVTEALLPAAG